MFPKTSNVEKRAAYEWCHDYHV